MSWLGVPQTPAEAWLMAGIVVVISLIALADNHLTRTSDSDSPKDPDWDADESL